MKVPRVPGVQQVQQVHRVRQVRQVHRVPSALGLVVALVTVVVAQASAQSPQGPALRAHHVLVSGGVMWSGSYPIGDATATLRTNAPGAGAPPFTLFSTASTLESATGVGGRVEFALTPNMAIEVGASFARPRISVAISQDLEAAAQVLQGESLQQYVVDAGVVWQVPVRLGRRARPFVSGGAGYLRQLHPERTLVETGRTYYAGGGVRYWIRGGDGSSRAVGLRADVRATWTTHGVDFEDRTRVAPSLALQAFVDF